MPSNGLISFLHDDCHAVKVSVIDVAMPLTGLLSFLHFIRKDEQTGFWCINALNRAHIISTLKSGNPHKHWLPNPIFASNSQNILTISIFSLL